jgi:hypothetical protein
MHDRRVKAAIRRAVTAGPDPRPASGHRDRLEVELLGAYRDRYPRHRRYLMLLNPWNRAARLALAGLAVALLGVGACSTSTTTEVEMGQKLTITMDGLSGDKADDSLRHLEGELNDFFAARPEVEGVNFNLRGSESGTVFEIMAWGRDVDAAALEADLLAQVPGLSATNVTIEPLSGGVRENLLQHFGHEILGLELELNGETADEIRAQIIARMAAAGIEGDARVVVEDTPDGRRIITVDVEGDTTVDVDGGSRP